MEVPPVLERAAVCLALRYRKMRYGYAYRRIKLTKGEYAKVDPEDYERLNQYKWYAADCHRRGYTCYAQRTVCTGGKKHSIMMHREVINAPKGMQVDHLNGDGRDNRKANLRIATAQQNNWNRIYHKKSSSRYTGVTWEKSRKKWRADIYENRRKKFLGFFDDEKEAAKAFDRVAKERRGEFARLNFPEDEGH